MLELIVAKHDTERQRSSLCASSADEGQTSNRKTKCVSVCNWQHGTEAVKTLDLNPRSTHIVSCAACVLSCRLGGGLSVAGSVVALR